MTYRALDFTTSLLGRPRSKRAVRARHLALGGFNPHGTNGGVGDPPPHAGKVQNVVPPFVLCRILPAEERRLHEKRCWTCAPSQVAFLLAGAGAPTPQKTKMWDLRSVAGLFSVCRRGAAAPHLTRWPHEKRCGTCAPSQVTFLLAGAGAPAPQKNKMWDPRSIAGRFSLSRRGAAAPHAEWGYSPSSPSTKRRRLGKPSSHKPPSMVQQSPVT
ncbi:MAG: hypothetical protein KatS3mg007_1948 [Thermoanaerobaculum sp.]|nr:MAG: hypothetical protein KatS3mg007_1948 [Thermoanaerobaculum sp.]